MARKNKKKLFTIDEANATLPLVRSILRDVTKLARELEERRQRLSALKTKDHLDAGRREELEHALVEFEKDRERLTEYAKEIDVLGIELKDPFTGLIDFPSRMDGRYVYLCWRMGEAEITHWHELDAGFAGRQPLPQSVVNH